jgi:hypothetical protein
MGSNSGVISRDVSNSKEMTEETKEEEAIAKRRKSVLVRLLMAEGRR